MGHDFLGIELTAEEQLSYEFCIAISDAVQTGSTWEVVTNLVEDGVTTLEMNLRGFFIEGVTDFVGEDKLNILNRQLHTSVELSTPIREQHGALDDVIQLLVEGASANAAPFSAFRDPFWECALVKAVENGAAEILKALIEHGGNVLATSENGNNLLHVAAETIDDDYCGNVLYTLCQAGVAIDAPNDDGIRPLDIIQNVIGKPLRQR